MSRARFGKVDDNEDDDEEAAIGYSEQQRVRPRCDRTRNHDGGGGDEEIDQCSK